MCIKLLMPYKRQSETVLICCWILKEKANQIPVFRLNAYKEKNNNSIRTEKVLTTNP